jgi:YVTN family beta-propeller protein
VRLCAVIVALVLTADAHAQALRRPVSLRGAAGDRVLVANRDSGTISVIDARALRVVDERKVGQRVSDLAISPNGALAFVTDEAAGELIRLSASTLEIIDRVRVAAYPVSVRVAPDGRWCSVASLWSRRLTLLDVTAKSPGVIRVIDLPFAPREQWIAPNGKRVVVADAFGGSLAAIDVSSGAIVATRSIEANNIRGLASNGRELLFAHQILDDHTPTESSRITWGQVVDNVLRAVPLDELTPGGNSEPIRHWSLYPLGRNGRGAGDPGAVVVNTSGLTVVALSGMNEVAVRESALDQFERIAVGRRPVSLAFSADERLLFVANQFDDSVSVINVGLMRLVKKISLGKQPETLSEQQLGEGLYYDARLSVEGWYSCNSCHTDGHTTGSRNDNFSDGSFGTPKQIPSLLGVESTRPWGWTGRFNTHEAQVQQSILGTMHGPSRGATGENVNAIATYIRSLEPAPGISVARGEPESDAARRGRRVFEHLRCGRCHAGSDFTSDRTYDVEPRDEENLTEFNPPSLLGVSQRSAFLHDGRAKSLREVFEKFGHPKQETIPPDQLDDLLQYLRRL